MVYEANYAPTNLRDFDEIRLFGHASRGTGGYPATDVVAGCEEIVFRQHLKQRVRDTVSDDYFLVRPRTPFICFGVLVTDSIETPSRLSKPESRVENETMAIRIGLIRRLKCPVKASRPARFGLKTSMPATIDIH